MGRSKSFVLSFYIPHKSCLSSHPSGLTQPLTFWSRWYIGWMWPQKHSTANPAYGRTAEWPHCFGHCFKFWPYFTWCSCNSRGFSLPRFSQMLFDTLWGGMNYDISKFNHGIKSSDQILHSRLIKTIMEEFYSVGSFWDEPHVYVLYLGEFNLRGHRAARQG